MVRDLQGGLWIFAGLLCHVAFLMHCRLLIFADQLLSVSESLWILAPSCPSRFLGDLQVSMGQVSCFALITQCDSAS